MKKQLILIMLLAISIMPTVAQNMVTNNVEVKQKMPQFPGGDNAFYAYLDNNVTLPSDFDKETFLKQHKNQFVPINVAFTIDVDGSIVNVKVIDGEDEKLDKKAKEIVEKMPKWEPGYQGDKPVKVQYAIPIRFNLM
jgi:TonB family protein